MTERYERIREALAMGPTRGIRYARDQEVRGPYGVGVAWCGTNTTSGRDGSYSIDTAEACANASLAAACDPDTIRALLEELDALRDFVEAKMHHLPIEDQHVASILVGEQEET